MTTNELQPLNRYDLQACTRRLPKAVLELLKRHPRRACVAGGYIRAVIAGEKVSDVDIFAQNKDHAKTLSLELKYEKRGFHNIEHPVHETDNAFTVLGYPLDPQIIHRWTFEDVMDVCPSFDFTIACAVLFYCDRLNEWQGFCDARFYQDLAAKRLVYRSPIRNEEAGGSMLRVLKFYQRGYRIPLDSLGAVMARCVKDIDMTGVTILSHNEGIDHEKSLAKIITGKLVEVDPVIDPSHAAHVPSLAD